MGKNNPREIKARRERELQAAASLTSDDLGASSSDLSATGGQIAAGGVSATAGQPVTGGLGATGSQLSGGNPLATGSSPASEQSQIQTNLAAQSASLQKSSIQGAIVDGEEMAPTTEPKNLESLKEQDAQTALDALYAQPEQDAQPDQSTQTTQSAQIDQTTQSDQDDENELPVIDGSTIQSYEVRERKPIDVRKVIKRIFIAMILVIVAAVICVIVSFSVFRWNMYDDSADIIGVWQVEGSDSTIEITDEAIKLTDDISYKYVLDEDAKTINFIFGNLTGEGHYRFSLDRNELAIIDGQWDWNQSLTEDVQWTKDALIEQYINGNELSPHVGYDDKNVTALKKISSS